MGLGGISVWQLLIVLLIVLALFGTKKLRSLGSDLGSAVKGFKNAIKDDPKNADLEKLTESTVTQEKSAEKSKEQV